MKPESRDRAPAESRDNRLRTSHSVYIRDIYFHDQNENIFSNSLYQFHIVILFVASDVVVIVSSFGRPPIYISHLADGILHNVPRWYKIAHIKAGT